MQKALFVMDVLNVTQKMNSNFSHKGVLAIDIAGKDTGIDPAYAPFDCIIKKIYTKNSNVVWFESLQPVLYADGTVDYMTVLMMHMNDVSGLRVGQTFKQSEKCYEEGTAGQATGNHIHLSAGKGKYSGTGWYENSYGYWCINNQYDITKALFLKTTTIIKNSGDYNWQVTNATN